MKKQPGTLTRRLSRQQLLLSVIPLVAICISAVIAGYSTLDHVDALLDFSIQEIGSDAKNQLVIRGEDYIKTKARDIARQLEFYIQSHPEMSISALQRTPEFVTLSIQGVGSSGYTCLYEAETGIMLLHPNIDLISKDLHSLSDKLPIWWTIFSSSLTGKEVSGYYEWEDSDGRVREKFMAMTPIYTRVAGKRLMIAATTYIDEFFEPINFLNNRQSEIKAKYQAYILQGVYLSVAATALILSTTLVAAAVCNSRATRRVIHPIEALAASAQLFGASGKWNISDTDPMLHREDEIGALARAISNMCRQINTQIEKLRESEARFRTAFENANVGICLVALDGTLVEVNSAFSDMIGRTPDDMVGTRVTGYTHPDDIENRSRFIDQLLGKTDDSGVDERRFIHSNGSVVTTQICARVQRNADGEPLYFISLVQDITGRKKAEDEKQKLEGQLRQAQKMEAIGTLAGGIAHDFNNILSVIMGNADILQLDDNLAESDRENLNQIRIAAERARQLVRQILTFSRQTEQQRVLVNLKPLVKETFDFLRSSIPATIELRSEICSDPALILADPTQIQQILMNLCTNSAHAMEKDGGMLTVRLENYTIDPAEAQIEEGIHAGEYLRLSVADTGHGIDGRVLERIFDPYFTTKGPGKGTGLGLSVVHGIVKALGGKIKVYSEIGQGTVFHVVLPAVDREESIEAKPVVSLPTGSQSILLIDDEAQLVDWGRHALERLGYQVETQTNPIEALKAFQSAPQKYDVVITDMTMPHMTGLLLAEALLDIRSDVPIILCSGFTDPLNEEKAYSIGVKAFLHKPVTMLDLAASIRQALSEPEKTERGLRRLHRSSESSTTSL